ncbi:lantibiotic dehydratase family protein [Flavobacterium muglaense]|uniref:Lantibiotic dehydratase family protein n=1 Tax=Flavobacterium muglaense TaxID=2764716 RepID=A0A923MZA0_9FLAO|nr:lantibiotic dehydratase family protein [Flavobacterium muglaense]MBC5837292.1 lantibiotic dehydratase family protein [Flavobacterium muglaense]MBC5843784.1 lantibiotic dehydratase family protein [Flavobacterium muglaense]
MKSYKVLPFSQYVLRTPTFPVSTYLNLVNDYAAQALLKGFENPFFREAIRIASPELLKELDRWKSDPLIVSPKRKDNLALTLLKYNARISSRCTPFGLFAGCTVGNFTNETNIILESPEKFKRFTQFDMQFWVALLQELATRKEIKQSLKFYPNNSIYVVGDFYRYVEYKYVKTKREHSISALQKSIQLDLLLTQAKSGLTINQMVSMIIDDESETKEALEYINQLIDFQFLVSELDATVTGNDDWTTLFVILNKIPALKEDSKLLQTVRNRLLNLDKNLIPSEKNYKDIKTAIQQMGLEYDKKYLFQTDLELTTSRNTLNTTVSYKVLKALRFLNGIQRKTKSQNHTQFTKAFIQRYESREMPLATVLDTEIGIGYIQNSDMNDTYDLLEKFTFKSKTPNEDSQIWTANDFVLQKKLQECFSKNEKVISLSEVDFPEFEANWDNTPATFSVMIEVATNQEKELIAIESSDNVSAAKLLGRFCNGNTTIHNLTKEIVEKEKKCYPDKILAEIVHIPESRTGNILRRPVLRDYEIAYLSNSGVTRDYALDINDLMVSIKNNRIILRSKKHDKEVIPCLSNAHNYSSQSLPIYHFLCDLQLQDVKPIYSFSWGILESHYDFFPRVNYKDVILSKAKWIVSKKEIVSFLKTDESQLFKVFKRWRLERNIPRFANWVHFDNTLLLDFEKEICVRLLLKSVSKYSKITLEEFLFAEGSIVKNKDGDFFSNQFILSFYKEEL